MYHIVGEIVGKSNPDYVARMWAYINNTTALVLNESCKDVMTGE